MTRSHIGQSYQCVSVNAAAVVLAKCDPSGPSLVKLAYHCWNRAFDGTAACTSPRATLSQSQQNTPQQHIGAEQKHGGCILCRLSAVLDSSQSHLAVIKSLALNSNAAALSVVLWAS